MRSTLKTIDLIFLQFYINKMLNKYLYVTFYITFHCNFIILKLTRLKKNKQVNEK